MKTRKRTPAALTLVLATALAACSSGSGGSGSDALISISMMDRPVDNVTAVNITVTEFWIKPQGNGPAFQLDMVDTPVTVNLLELSIDDPAIFVDRARIPAGTYNWLEMSIDESDVALAHVMTDDGMMKEVDIDVPSDRVRLINNFEVAENDSVRLLFDWNVRAGLTEAVGRDVFILKPVIRVLDVMEFATVVGEISSATITDPANECDADSADAMNYDEGNVIYVFEGAVDPADFGVVEPYTTVDAKDSDNDGDWEYRVPLMPETYTIAATCQGGFDAIADPATYFLPVVSGDAVVTFDSFGEIAGPNF